MFESITINRRDNPFYKQPFSVGHLAECLLFYGKVNIIISPKELELLIKKCDIERLVELIESERLSISISMGTLGSLGAPNTSRFGYGMFFKKGEDLESATYRAIHSVYKNSIKSSKNKNLILPYLTTHDYKSEVVDEFLKNKDFTTKTFKQAIQRTYPGYPIPLGSSFELEKTSPQDASEKTVSNVYRIETDFDLKGFENELMKKSDDDRNFGFPVTYIMAIANAIHDLKISSDFQTEISTNEISSEIIKDIVEFVQIYYNNSESKIIDFKNCVIGNLPSIAETIDSGHKSFDDFLQLLNRSQKFSTFLRGVPFDANIVNEYINEVNAKDFTDNLFFKVARFVTSVNINFTASPVIGLPLEWGLDYLLDKLKMWKPNQFVETDLKPFVKK